MDKSKRQQRLEKKRQEKRRSQMRLVGIVAVAAVGLAALFIFAGQVRVPDVEHNYTNKNGTELGDPNAPVLVVEYGDFQCSHCRNFYATTEPLLIENYVNTGLVRLEYRPLDYGGVESTLSGEASLCAADQNMFWEFHDIVFANYSTGNSGGYSEARLNEFASTLDMDQEAFRACLSSGKKSEALQVMRRDAVAFGVRGTPSFLINGMLMGGNVPYQQLSQAIEDALDG